MSKKQGKKGKKAGSVPAKVSGSNVPAGLDEFEDDAGGGLEGVTPDDMAIPFLAIAQALSPQVKKRDALYIEDCEEGDVFNTVTRELFKGEEGMDIIPVAYRRTFVNWEPRDSGGGLKAVYSVEEGLQLLRETERDDKGRDALDDGTYLADTRSFFVLIVENDVVIGQAIMSMSSTQLKKARHWLTRMNTLKMDGKQGLFTPPMYSQIYRVRTVPEENAKGAWFGWAIDHVGPIKDPNIYEAAKAFHESVTRGEVKAAQPAGDDEDIPF